jgi:hypothetical protein
VVVRKGKEIFFPFFVFISMDINQYIEDSDKEELQSVIERYFNDDYEMFFNYIDSEDDIDLDENFNFLADMFPAGFLLWWMNNKDSDSVLKYTINNLSDVVEKDGKYYMTLSSLGDIACLFRYDRDVSTKTIASIMNGEYDWSWDYYQDYGDSIVDDLTPENLTLLIDKIKEKSLNKEITYNGNSDLIIGFCEKDDSEDTFIMTSERLDAIVKANELYELLDESDFFEDLKRYMNSWFNWGYESAYYDEIYNDIFDEVKSFFGVKELGKWETKTKKRYDGTEYTSETYHLDVTNKFYDFVLESIESSQTYPDEEFDMIGYYGSLESYICGVHDGSARLRDWDYISPDWSNLRKNYNEQFRYNI